MSQWKTIYRHLTDRGFSVYSPGQHQGECTSRYVVIRPAGSTPKILFTSHQDVYDLLCYVPRDKYSTLEDFVMSVKQAMKGLYPTLIPTQYETASYYDDQVKGHMISIEYRNSVKNL